MSSNPTVIILDFGSQFTQLIARSIRELGVYCEIEPYSIKPKTLHERRPRALVLSGGPASVYAGNSPTLKNAVFNSGLPVLGICYGMQLLSQMRKGRVAPGNSREYGACPIEVLETDGLFAGFEKHSRHTVWMSHGDSVTTAPAGSTITARSERCPVVGYQLGNFHGVQFHPEVAHTPIGKQLFSNFLFRVAGLKGDWKLDDFLKTKAAEITDRVGDNHVIGGVSGGVDSTVLAAFLGKTLGKQFHPILVDNGLLRREEAKEVKSFLAEQGISLKVVNASGLFLKRLATTTNPETKRKIIGKTFIDVFAKECERIPKATFLAQGTLYPDVIESVSIKGPSHLIKTHHNVGGLPKRMHLELIEPFRELFKDEVRVLGRSLGLGENVIGRHPFPGPGLAVRILGRVTPERLRVLRQADAIFIEELKRQCLYDQIWQAFGVLLPVQSVGVMGDARTYESVLALRAVTSRDGMTADWFGFTKDALGVISSRIVNEVRGINRVVYDISSKPPATIEWE